MSSSRPGAETLGVAHEENPFSLEIDLNDVPRRKKFLA